MTKEEKRDLDSIFFEALKNKTVQKIENEYPGFGISKIKIYLLQDKYFKLTKHILSLYKHGLDLRVKKGVREIDWNLFIVSVLYHDIPKVFFDHFNDLSWFEKKILGEEKHHSISAMRIFLSVDDIVLAHCVRHNSSDFVYDIARNNILIPQLLLNVVDKSDIKGVRVSIEEKYQYIKNKIGNHPEYDDSSEQIACYFLSKVLSEDRNIYDYEFVHSTRPKKEKVIFVQRFDGKYCSPVGQYEDTNSNLKICNILSRWDFDSVLLNEGDDFYKYSEQSYFIGVPSLFSDKLMPLFCFNKDVVVVEGMTSRIVELKKSLGKTKKLVLLLRTLANGDVEKYRLENMSMSDEIWVMTEHMKFILEDRSIAQKVKLPKIKILQSGYDKNIFFEDKNIKRKEGKIVYVGALTEIKGVDLLINAFKKIQKDFPKAELHLIGGEGIYGHKNHFEINKFKKIKNLFFYGTLREKSVASHLRNAHFSCLLTKIYETFGKSAMQARVCGTRMIVSNMGNLPNHVKNKNEGIVLEELNEKNVESALRKMLSEKPKSVLPEEDRYNYWLHTALDFYSHYVTLSRKTIFD